MYDIPEPNASAMNKELFKPSYLRGLCEKYGLSPSKKYGQNYLISDRPIREIIEAGELSPNDTVVEIGPGFGVLTLAMAPLVKKIFTFEIERTLEPYWNDEQKEFPNIEVVWGNVLNQVPHYETEIFDKLKNYKVLANIPYQITSKILRLLLEEVQNKPERIVLMIQKEVGERIIAKPKDMSMLAVSVQYYGEPKIISKVSKGCFWPNPKVDSALLMIKPYRDQKNNFTDKEFFELVRAGFSHPRKQLWHNLAQHYPNHDFKSILYEITGNERIRAEELSVEDWKKIVQSIH